ncbi:MAG: thiamine phosphate synthase [Candidatus Hydrogenedentes bacterium]|nr:thiamine phosphate synthase [Candidatus Hydrogenedentota bacterium]
MTHGERGARFEAADLYVVITEAFCAGRSALDVLDAVLDAGVKLVQCREKDCDDSIYYERALAFRERTAKAGALLIIDDRVDIALAAGADGVHLGTADLPIQTARAIAPELLLGASSHSIEEALAAQDAGADYVNIGPVFDTQTKAVPTGTVGPALIGALRPHLRIPFTTMGGIKAHNIRDVLAQGARRIAVVTAVTAAEDVRAAAKELREAIGAWPECP